MMPLFFREWLEYFQWNAEEPDTLPWQARESLGDSEKADLGPSLAAFQLGENSEGSTLRRLAAEYAERNGFGMLPDITVLFIAEERNHSALLARFMEKHGIPKKESDWTDGVFRALRRPFGYEAAISILITAEIIGLVYYRALREATGSRLLRAICNKILEDEKAHLDFESALIRFAQASRGPWARGAWRLAHRCLFAATVAVVFREHRKVLLRGGRPFIDFFDDCRKEFHRLFPASVKSRYKPGTNGAGETGNGESGAGNAMGGADATQGQSGITASMGLSLP